MMGAPQSNLVILPFMPAGFLVAIIVSLLWPSPGEHVAHYKVRPMRPAFVQLALQTTCHGAICWPRAACAIPIHTHSDLHIGMQC